MWWWCWKIDSERLKGFGDKRFCDWKYNSWLYPFGNFLHLDGLVVSLLYPVSHQAPLPGARTMCCVGPGLEYNLNYLLVDFIVLAAIRKYPDIRLLTVPHNRSMISIFSFTIHLLAPLSLVIATWFKQFFLFSYKRIINFYSSTWHWQLFN